MAPLALAFDVLGRDRGASTTLDRVGDKAERTGSRLGGLGKIVGGLAPAFAALGAVNFAKGLVADAEEARKVAAQTKAVLKSTGGVANVSAGDIDKLTAAISRKTAVDDEAIAEGSNLLLTFTNIRNEVGEGNDVFNQANETLVDMAAALGTDVKSGAVQLGKALNDPVKGISALSRVGVTFTEQQKEQIKAMADAGDMAGAQRIILAELNKEFGGSAAAQATASDRLQVVWGNLREELGEKLLPIVDRVATWLSDKLPVAIDAGKRALQPFLDAWNENGIRGVLQTAADNFERGWPILQEKFGMLADKIGEWLEPRMKPFADALGRFIQKAAGYIGDNIGSWAGAFLGWIAPLAVPLLAKAGELQVKFTKWILLDALPSLVAALAKWGWAFVQWIIDSTPYAISQLDEVALTIGRWLINDGLPAFNEKLHQWRDAFVGWIADAAVALPGKMMDFQRALFAGMVGIGDALIGVMAGIGSAMWSALTAGGVGAVNWIIEKAINPLVARFNDLVGTFNKLPGFDLPTIDAVAPIGGGSTPDLTGGIAGGISIVVNNPAPEPASTTTERELRTIVGVMAV